MGRRRGSDNFNFNSFKANAGINNVPTVKGSDNQGQLLRPLPFERRFRPAVGTKDFSVLRSFSRDNSWSVVNENTLSIPASGPPAVGEYLTTEMRAQCTCPDFLGREGFDLYQASIRRKYPYTRVQNMAPGFYDAGTDQTTRLVNSPDDPGFARTFGFLYTNEIYNIPSYEQPVYSDPNFFYYQPKWCKHIYAAMWDLQRKYGQENMTAPWLPQPTDEPMNEYYREKFAKDLAKQTDFYKRERDLRWWQRYSPTKNDMPRHMTYPDMYNMMSKTLNFGDLNSLSTINKDFFQMFTVDEFDPFAPVTFEDLDSYDGGTYENGVLVNQPIDTLDGGEYANGVLIPPAGFPSLINGGTY
jgi:hypothetical protein